MRFLAQVLFICILCTVSCSGQTNDKTEIIQTVLDHPEMEEFLHMELENRIPLYILKNEYISEKLNLTKGKHKVVIVEDTTGTKGNYIKMTDLTVKDRKAEFSLYYKIENMEMSGRLQKEDGKWTVSKIDNIIEF